MRGKAYLGLALLAGIAGLALMRDEIPHWRSAGADPVAHAPLAPLGKFPILLDSGKPVMFIGDSNMSGGRVGGRDHAFPALLALPARVGAMRVNLAVGGAIAPSDLAQDERFAQAQLAVVMFGTNDAAPRRFLAKRAAVSVSVFRDRLEKLVRDVSGHGAEVLILAAPPAGSVAMDQRIAPYRAAARVVAERTGARFLDPMAALAPDEATPAVLARDGIHLTMAGQERVARWLDQRLAAR